MKTEGLGKVTNENNRVRQESMQPTNLLWICLIHAVFAYEKATNVSSPDIDRLGGGSLSG